MSKIQFHLLDKELDELYQKNRDHAKRFGVKIDFTKDFLKWFFIENKKAENLLEEYEKKGGEKHGCAFSS